MRWTAFISFCFCIILGVMGMPSRGASADIELNGYIFSDDSTELWKNPYFSNYSRGVVFNTILFGYGDFAGKEFKQTFWQEYVVAGIPCIMFREQGYFPSFNEATSSFDMDEYNSGSIIYAKDTEDNIHILSMGNQGYSWSYSDLPEGGTTLKYPSNPVPGQEVFCGHVEATGVPAGEIRDLVTISFDSLPQYPSKAVTEYLRPGAGVIAISYNWEGRTNGFSFDAVPPEQQEEDKGTWEEWKDDHCFISVCSPKRSCHGSALHKVIDRILRTGETVRNTLTSVINKY